MMSEMAAGRDPRAPLVIEIDDDDKPDPTFDLAAGEREITVCNALSMHTASVFKAALGQVKVYRSRGSRSTAHKRHREAYDDGVRDASKIRLR